MPDPYGFDLVTDLRMQMGMMIAVGSRGSMAVITNLTGDGRPPIFNAMELAYLSGQLW